MTEIDTDGGTRACSHQCCSWDVPHEHTLDPDDCSRCQTMRRVAELLLEDVES
jgi:hypothetical protein